MSNSWSFSAMKNYLISVMVVGELAISLDICTDVTVDKDNYGFGLWLRAERVADVRRQRGFPPNRSTEHRGQERGYQSERSHTGERTTIGVREQVLGDRVGHHLSLEGVERDTHRLQRSVSSENPQKSGAPRLDSDWLIGREECGMRTVELPGGELEAVTMVNENSPVIIDSCKELQNKGGNAGGLGELEGSGQRMVERKWKRRARMYQGAGGETPSTAETSGLKRLLIDHEEVNPRDKIAQLEEEDTKGSILENNSLKRTAEAAEQPRREQ